MSRQPTFLITHQTAHLHLEQRPPPSWAWSSNADEDWVAPQMEEWNVQPALATDRLTYAVEAPSIRAAVWVSMMAS